MPAAATPEPAPPSSRGARAWWAGVLGTDGVETVDLAADPGALDRQGWWAVVQPFEGGGRADRFATRVRTPLPRPREQWRGPRKEDWSTSIDREGYRDGVRRIRELVRRGEVYQVNLCRVLSAPTAARPDPWALAARLAAGNPAPYAGVVDHGPGAGWVVSASPELFLRREGDRVASGPIKGTAPTADGLLDKDRAENVMITDLVRNDLSRVCLPGTVEVDGLLREEAHPGLVHLVSTVRGILRTGVGWEGLLAATSPAGSVSGAPKSTALQAISALEPVPRGPYCGGLGWVDGERGELAVGIRSFWWAPEQAGGGGGVLRFGTGAGITWGSDPDAEWAETQLKAARLVALASGDAVVSP